MNRPQGVAFKVTYNDGGAASVNGVGYRGVCSDATILHNVRGRQMTNCAAQTPCAKFVAKGLKSRYRPREPSSLDRTWCYEAGLLKRSPWTFGAGAYHRGERAGEAIPMRGGERGDIAIMTTRLPGASEAERCVFALYRIGRHRLSADGEHWIDSDRTMEIRIPDELLGEVRYWDYVDAAPDWRMGLFRYLDVDATARLVSEVTYLLGDRDAKDVILRALPSVRPAPPRAGGGRGGLGEGPAHKALKERVANDPALIGLPPAARASVEHTFLSGDRVDIAFTLNKGRHAVVEVETYFAEPGVHQAVKYRSLMEVQLGLPLGSGKVQAILVAHVFDKATLNLAGRYGVRCVQVSPA